MGVGDSLAQKNGLSKRIITSLFVFGRAATEGCARVDCCQNSGLLNPAGICSTNPRDPHLMRQYFFSKKKFAENGSAAHFDDLVYIL